MAMKIQPGTVVKFYDYHDIESFQSLLREACENPKIQVTEGEFDEATGFYTGYYHGAYLMAASPSQERINSVKRRELQKLAKKYHGVYDKFRAFGVYEGISWSATYETIRASNGEVALIPVFGINGIRYRNEGSFEHCLHLAKTK